MRRPTFASSGSSSTSVVSAALAAAIFGWPVPSSALIDFDASTTRITAASLSGAGCAWACAPAGASSRRSIPRAPRRDGTAHPPARVPKGPDARCHYGDHPQARPAAARGASPDRQPGDRA